MLVSELEKLSSKEVQEYVFLHENDDVQNLLLKNKEVFGLPFGIVADQIIGRKKFRLKVPTLYSTTGVLYPPAFNLEQSSSEKTALFKIKILSEIFAKKSIADLTGGFGIDSLFFNEVTKHIDFIEPNEDLLILVKHNFETLRRKNVDFQISTAEDFLSARNKKFDLIYLDPSRRDLNQKKVFRLQDCTPNVVDLQKEIFEKSDLMLIKVSPLLDISQGLKELIFVKKIMIVSVDNECKELLFLSEKNFDGEPTIETYNLTKDNLQKFSFQLTDEVKSVSDFSPPLLFLYEPNSSILKSGCFKLIGEKFQLKKIGSNTHLYTSDTFVQNFPGRVFRIEKEKFDSKKDLTDKKANVVTRNYPLKTEELRKKLKLEDGGEKYVIGFSGQEKKYVILASKVQ